MEGDWRSSHLDLSKQINLFQTSSGVMVISFILMNLFKPILYLRSGYLDSCWTQPSTLPKLYAIPKSSFSGIVGISEELTVVWLVDSSCIFSAFLDLKDVSRRNSLTDRFLSLTGAFVENKSSKYVSSMFD